VQDGCCTDWNSVHDSTNGTYAGDSTTIEEAAGVGRSGSTDKYFIDRGFFYFDTSSLLESDGIASSTFSIYADSKNNDDNDGDDWLTIVQVQGDDIVSDTAVGTTDFEHNGSAVDNPTEGIATTNRKDLSAIATGAYIDFDLNSTGRGWIARGTEESPSGGTPGITYLGIREGHDVIDSAFVRPGGSTAFNRVQTRFADYSGTTSDPKLTVISGDTSCTATTTRVYEARVENGAFNYYAFNGCVWTMTDKRGVVYTFGSTTDERLVDPEDGARTFRWMLQEVRDRNGNFMTFEYTKDVRQVYPYKITYTHNGSSEDGLFEAEFTKTWQPDTATTTSAGFYVKNNYKITQIQTKVNGEWVRKYDLTYATSSKNASQLLSSITEDWAGRPGKHKLASCNHFRLLHRPLTELV
jgi:Salmonella virulence plasmid 65kDa B protein